MKLSRQIQEIMQQAIDTSEVAGISCLVMQHGKEQLYVHAGYADCAAEKEVKRDSIFRLYSQTKPVTATAVMMLVEEGRLDLLDEARRFLPGFENQYVLENGERKPVRRAVTVMDLLSMSSGLVYPDADEAGQAMAELFEKNENLMDAGQGMDTVSFANAIGACPLAFQPGTAFRYGTSADVLGAIVEVVSGMPYADFLKERIFEPLGMIDTDFWVPAEKMNRVADVYDSVNGQVKFTVTDHLGINYKADHRPAFESGGAGLFSTLDDYSHFAEMLLNNGEYNGKRLLSEKAVKFMTNGSIAPWQQKGLDTWDGLTGYTYGNLMRVLRDPSRCLTYGEVGEYGWDGWLGAYFSNDPQNKLTILIGMQKLNAGTWNLTRKIRNLVYKEVR